MLTRSGLFKECWPPLGGACSNRFERFTNSSLRLCRRFLTGFPSFSKTLAYSVQRQLNANWYQVRYFLTSSTSSIGVVLCAVAVIPSCVQMNATWYKGGGNRRPQVFENDGFPSFFKNFGVQRSTPVERNLVLNHTGAHCTRSSSFQTPCRHSYGLSDIGADAWKMPPSKTFQAGKMLRPVLCAQSALDIDFDCCCN